MSTTTTQTQTTSNTTETQKDKVMDTKLDSQTGKSPEATAKALRNTDWTPFQKMADRFFADYKGDTQELEMIVSLLPVQDVLGIDNLKHLIRGDKELYKPEARKNAKPGSVTNPTPANQQRGALLELLPHYKELREQAKLEVLNATIETSKAQKKLEKAGQRKLSNKEILSLFKTTKADTKKSNVKKGEATLKCDALEQMFSRAIGELYFLRRVSADAVKLNKAQRTITYTGFAATTDEGKVHLSEQRSDYEVTLAELGKATNSVLKGDLITASRTAGKGANATKSEAQKATDAAASAKLNPVQTTADNSKELSKMIRALNTAKGETAKVNRVAYKNAEAPKQLFTDMVQALFITEGALDLPALQKAIDVAMVKGKVARKVAVLYGEDIPATNGKKTA